MDASKASFWSALLYNREVKPSVPLAYAVQIKNIYKTMKSLLKAINYSEYSRKIC